ncbi:Type IV pilus biogenesis and competence protein PilQ precursor [Anaerohalosphaera lusitana]|uniref:Type IV pilus biogenesis and competence protein PilQ n=1 Tax=Anaerohalosphaera lusitana TaxID=1936003 RepID=A0A1U9NNR3_9BACT|nr:secretin N-terminal domain-containing protein [Anaerohalosphaera lusitana]AQT69592.1 Type IV pilus biogenesis and competence protein PilQ precursor [Anaerohalosphaera lusitana]
MKKQTIKSISIFAVICFAVLCLVSSRLTAAEHQAAEEEKSETRELSQIEKRMQQPVSLDFRETPIEDVLRMLAKQADVDIIKSPEVTGNVTATLTEVPLSEALDNILAAHGYGYVTTKNMIRVVPRSQIINVVEPMVSRIYRVTYADVVEVEKALSRFLSDSGSLSSNPGTSNIIINDTESKIAAIDEFIEEIDRVTPQILVEARIYDVSTNDSLDLGVEWFAGRRTQFDPDTGLAVSGDTDPFIRGEFDSGLQNTTATDGLLRFGILNEHVDIDATIFAEQEQGCAKLLANPRILVMDNELANIKIVSEVPFQQLTQTMGGGNIGTTEFKEVGVSLEVVPHLTRDGMIRLQLRPEFSVQVDTVSIIIPNQEATITSPQPVIDKREAVTTTLIKDGQTVVIGGLKKKDTFKDTSKIPLLGDIPLAGGLFRFDSEKIVNSELVVFITPYIVSEPVLTANEAARLKQTEFCSPDCRKSLQETCGQVTHLEGMEEPEKEHPYIDK